MTASALFYQTTGKRWLYNIMPIDNIPSVLEHGLLCYHEAKKYSHTSIAMNEVQARRESTSVPGGLPLHDYANLYFVFWNPMLYKRKDENEKLCILAFSAAVLDMEGCVVSDRNAASTFPKFYEPEEGIRRLSFEKIYDKYWVHDEYDAAQREAHKKIKCAEVLVPYRIPVEYMDAACVVSENSKNHLEQAGFSKEIIVKPERFF